MKIKNLRKIVDAIFPICFFITPIIFILFLFFVIIKNIGQPIVILAMGGVSLFSFFLGIVFGIWLDNDTYYDDGEW